MPHILATATAAVVSFLTAVRLAGGHGRSVVSAVVTWVNLVEWIASRQTANLLGLLAGLWALALATRDRMRDTRLRDMARLLDDAREQSRANRELIDSAAAIRRVQGSQVAELTATVASLEAAAERQEFEVVQLQAEFLRERGVMVGAFGRKGPIRGRRSTDIAPGMVLVVEDDERTRIALGRVLGHHGFGVDFAVDVPGAVAVLSAMADKGRRPDFILLDLNLPGEDGLGVLRQVRNLRLDSTVIVTTGVVGDDIVRRAREHGAAAVLPKPYDLAQLLALLGCPAPPPRASDSGIQPALNIDP